MKFHIFVHSDGLLMHFRFIIFMLLTGFSLQAQQIASQLHIRSGLSQPLLEYASYNLVGGGFAQSGLTVSAAVSSIVNERWGIHVQGGLQLHPLAVERLGYEKVEADPFLEDVTIRSEPYRILHFVGGPAYRNRLGKMLTLDFRLLAGLFSNHSPHQLYKPNYFLTGPDFYEITSSLDRSFAYGAGVTASFKLSSCYTLGLEADFMSSEAAFQFYTSSGIRTDYKQIRMLNLSVSLLLSLPEISLK